MRSSRTLFADRTAAGRELAGSLRHYQDRGDVIVYGLPRGGVPVAFEVASELNAPLDVLVVRKLGVPGHSELAMGAVASRGVQVLNDDVIRQLGISETDIERTAARERDEVRQREDRFRGGQDAPDPKGAVAIVIDDGIATGSTMRASVEALREMGPEKIVVAVPVASPDVCAEFEEIADEVICLAQEHPFGAVGMWYANFNQTTDEEVVDLLARARR